MDQQTHSNNQHPWHALEINDVILQLKSNPDSGLGLHAVQMLIEICGPNQLPHAKKKSIWILFLSQFKSPLIYLLLFASFAATVIENFKDALVILIVTVLNAVIGSIQEGRAEQYVRALRSLAQNRTRVLRNHQDYLIEASALVPGDIILLSSGDAVPADSRIIESNALSVSQAALTGESVPVFKRAQILPESIILTERSNMLYAGTYLTAGRCKAVVVATGIFNEIGQIADLASTGFKMKTPLEQRIHRFGNKLSLTAISLFFIFIAIGTYQNISFAEIFMLAISQMVSLVPEGLPVAITISLAVGMQRMAKKGTIVRRLSAVETLGSVTVVCTDKTGTLTKNEMTVTELYLPLKQQKILVTGIGYSPEGKFILNGSVIDPLDEGSILKLLEAGILCNDSQLIKKEHWEIIGDPTEGALLVVAKKAGLDPDLIRSKFPRISEIAFDPEIKMMATDHLSPSGEVTYIKGAPEEVLKLSSYLFDNGNLQTFTSEEQKKTLTSAKEMANNSFRVLGLGMVLGNHLREQKNFLSMQNKVIFLGLVAEYDPPREEVLSSLENCLKAGIKTVMLTGDHRETGQAIATKLGILQSSNVVIDGDELDRLSDEELKEKIPSIAVYARVQPRQKLRIVKAYQSRGEIVAMTGDGVNDAPSLVCANVGVAMGKTGTDVAREAATVVVTDDNYSTIIDAIAEGRLVHQNIKKLILFLFVTSLDEVIILLLALIFGYSPPLAAVQILWINLVSEGVLTVNLIMEPLEGEEMNNPPKSPNHPLIDGEMLSRIPIMTTVSVIVTFGWFLYRSSLDLDFEIVQTETFTMLVVCQWFNVLNCRSASQSALSFNLIKNPWLLSGLIMGNLLQLAVIYWQPLAQFMHTVPIKSKEFFIIGCVASLVLWFEELRKIFSRRRNVKKLSCDISVLNPQ